MEMKTKYLIQISILLVAIIISSCSTNSRKPNNSEKSHVSKSEKLNYKIITSDIDNFWVAYDSLQNTTDSISTIQRLYIDKASDGLLEFLKVRPRFTSKAYVEAIVKYPKFWKSVRQSTLNIEKNALRIKSAFMEIKKIYPEFEIPDICFAISPVSAGGTTAQDNKMLLIGTEIVAADSSVDISEFNNILKDILGTLNVPLYIIHEAIHTSQNPMCEPSILTETLMEGSAEFISHFILKKEFRTKKYEYGYENECDLWGKIKVDIENDTNYDKWFGSYSNNKHPDMGYFIGYRIIEAYYEQADNKEQALVDIIKLTHPGEILNKSNYDGNCNN